MELEDRVLDVISNNPTGATNAALQAAHPGSGLAELVEVINKLVSKDKIQIFHKGKQLVYMLKDPESAKKCKGVDVEDKLIYQLIEKAGNKGIWIRDLRYASNIPQAQVNKILKSLESKKLIKSVNSVAASKKKLYMVHGIEPDRSVTGGTWYSDQEFESEFVDVLNQQCHRFLQQARTLAEKQHPDPISRKRAAFKTSQEICGFINGLKVSKVELSVTDVETILETLVFDGKVERSPEDPKSFSVVRPLLSSCGLMRVPCGVCPVHRECREGGVVSPTSCPYMKEWLDF
ncbi:hypothetical protein JTE90_006277 [Oedothorax gibbosus]|uniref:DNA-directed RNA polymerase III subunit RPC6 n=1 Tax=Oedothorax gibbosus TaxID=931172 RepID=A0AAV6U799_9ARAC|nr:hypothetical protein JTE90_006277 [Oedothorax gibbosus]